MNTLTVAGVEIPIMPGDIGVSISGGADSSLLLYILMKYTSSHIHAFTLAKNTNLRVSAITSAKIIEKCIQLTGNIRITHHVTYAETLTRNTLFDLPIEYSNTGKIQYMYTAVTANPPKEIADGFLGEEQNSEHYKRDPKVKRKVIDDNWIMPFFNIDKKTIYAMYKELDILDTVYPFTFSCENITELETYTHCGNCWWCKEREWGFGALCR